MLSFVYPICDRTELFKHTLESLVCQTMPLDEFEVVVVDDGGTDTQLVPLLHTFRQHGLVVRYFRIDVDRLRDAYGEPVKIYRHGLFNNPAPALNVGIRHAAGDRIVLSSPEILHEIVTNVERIDSWPLDESEALICDVFDPGLIHHPNIRGWIGGGHLRRPLHFLAAYAKSRLMDVGGFEERFVQGWGFDDTEFVDRWQKWGGAYVFTGGAVKGYHQPHARVEDTDAAGVAIGQVLWDEIRNDPTYLVANPGREMGSSDLIVESLWT